MTIAVHIPGVDPESSFHFWCFKEMAKNYPSVQMLFLTDASNINETELLPNCKTIRISPTITNGLTHYYWYQMKLPTVLELNNVVCFFSTGCYCSLKTDVRQVMLIEDDTNSGYNNFGIVKKYIRRASAIAFTNKKVSRKLLFKYPQIKNKIVFTGKGIHPAFHPSSENVEHPFSDKIYFVCTINEQNKLEARKLLKAYSIYKKWQHSSIEIVFILETKSSELPVEDFSSYKHRSQIHIIYQPSLKVKAAIFKSAFCWIGLSKSDVFLDDALRAIQCNVPVLYTAKIDLDDDIYLQSELSEKSIAEKMMVIYRDEYLINQQKLNASNYLLKYNWLNMHKQLYNLAKGDPAETT